MFVAFHQVLCDHIEFIDFITASFAGTSARNAVAPTRNFGTVSRHLKFKQQTIWKFKFHVQKCAHLCEKRNYTENEKKKRPSPPIFDEIKCPHSD